MAQVLIAQNIDEDTVSAPDVDMLMCHRGPIVFAWSSADQVIHVLDMTTGQQLPRCVHEMEFWTKETLEAFADHYLELHPQLKK